MIFSGVVSDEVFEVWFAAVRVVECFKWLWKKWNRSGNVVHTKATGVETYSNFLTEKLHGSKSCGANFCPDNYWCYSLERAVHTYVERSSNSKHLELTFAKAESLGDGFGFDVTLHLKSFTQLSHKMWYFYHAMDNYSKKFVT